MTKPLLSPRNDAVFKMLFADARDLAPLIDFLQAVLNLPAEDFAEVTLADPHLTREGADDKLGILDVKVKTATGNSIDIEIQIANHPRMRERIVFYLAGMVTGQISEGDDYTKIKRSICILITDFVLIVENGCYHNQFMLRDPDTGAVFTDLLEIDTLELPKLPNEDGTKLLDWLKFLKATTKEELAMLSEKNPQIKKIAGKLMALSDDERTRMLAESREKLRRDFVATREDGIEEGLKKGREEGREEGRAEGLEKGREEERLAIARNLLGLGRPVEEIMIVTGLSKKEIQSLLH
jgi:predicted transposase/invertase (TIGR01784 family)